MALVMRANMLAPQRTERGAEGAETTVIAKRVLTARNFARAREQLPQHYVRSKDRDK